MLNQISVDKLRLALGASSLAIWEWNSLTDEVVWYSDHQHLPGLTSSVFTGSFREFLQRVYPEDRDLAARSMTAAIATRSKYQQDLRMLTPERGPRWIALECQVVGNHPEQGLLLIGTTIDITERKQAEMALQRQNDRERLVILITQRLRRSLNLEDILHTTVDEVREFLQADRVIVYRFQSDWSGTVVVESKTDSCGSIAGATVQDTYFGEFFAQFYQQGGITAIADIQVAALDPHYLNLLQQLQVKSLLILPISQRNALWGLLVVHQCAYCRVWEPSDINLLRKLANQLAVAVHQSELHHQVQQLNNTLEQQVRERTLQLQQALDFEAVLRRITEKVRDSLDESQILQTAVRELALALEVENCNAALYNLSERTSTICYEHANTASEQQGLRFQMDQFPQIYQPLLKGQTLEYCPLMANPESGRVVKLACPILVHSTLSHTNEEILGDLWLTRSEVLAFEAQEVRLVQQVADQCAIALRQARLYQAAQAQVEELAKLNQLKDDFLSTVSHELRTPMASIKVAIQMLEVVLQPLGILDTQHKAYRYFQILQGESEREIQLINDLLDLSLLDSGSEPLLLTPVNLNYWIPHVVEPFETRIQAQQQQLNTQIASDLPMIQTDLGYLERILTELLDNACKYTPEGETITVSADTTHHTLRIRVSNFGIEIPPEERDRIFDKFYRIPNHDPWKYCGTGLGLALVKRLVEQIGATIEVESQHKLTTFMIQFPLALLRR